MKNLAFKYKIDVGHKRADEGKGFLPMCGWHQNYIDFKFKEMSGTCTFINGILTVIINDKDGIGRNSFEIPLSSLLEAIVMKTTEEK